MFEAHNIYADECLFESDNSGIDNAGSVQPADIHLLHTGYQCPLYIWFARGKRKDQDGVARPTWYIHVEYRQHNGSHGYRLLEVADDNGLPSDVWQTLTELELPQLCPEQTRRNPVGR